MPAHLAPPPVQPIIHGKRTYSKMIKVRVPCRKFFQEVPLWIRFTTNVVVLMCTKNLSLPVSDAAESRSYVSLVQQPENSLHWLTDSRRVAAKWSPWRAQPLIGNLCITSLNLLFHSKQSEALTVENARSIADGSMQRFLFIDIPEFQDRFAYGFITDMKIQLFCDFMNGNIRLLLD